LIGLWTYTEDAKLARQTGLGHESVTVIPANAGIHCRLDSCIRRNDGLMTKADKRSLSADKPRLLNRCPG
jgi:hypothetical protein